MVGSIENYKYNIIRSTENIGTVYFTCFIAHFIVLLHGNVYAQTFEAGFHLFCFSFVHTN